MDEYFFALKELQDELEVAQMLLKGVQNAISGLF